MGCPPEVEIGDNLVFTVCTHDPDTGVLTDADAVPTYRVYEDETTTAILTGSMAKLDDDNTTGFYSELIACTSGNGFESGKSYTIYIEATIDSDKGGICYSFKAYDQRKSNAIQISGSEAAANNVESVFLGTGHTDDVDLSARKLKLDSDTDVALEILSSDDSAIKALSSASGKHGMELAGNVAGSGLKATGGSTGAGIDAQGGSSSGAGIKAAAAANNDAGMELVKNGTGKDLDADETDNILDDTDELQSNQGNWLTATGFSTHDAAAVKTAMEAEGSNLDELHDLISGGKIAAQVKGTDDIDLSATQKASVQTAAEAAIVAKHLDHVVAVAGSVSDASATVNDFDTDLSEATDNHYNGNIMMFTSGVLDQQSARIWHYTGSSKNIQVLPALTEAPGNGDDFVIFAMHDRIQQNIQVIPSIPTAIDLCDTATVRFAIYFNDMLQNLVLDTEIGVGLFMIERKAVGAASWTTVVSFTSPTAGHGMVYYDEVVDSGTGYAAGDMLCITFKGQTILRDGVTYYVDPTFSYGMKFYTHIREMPSTALNTAIPGSPTTDSVNQRVKAIDELTEASGDGDLAAVHDDTNELQGNQGNWLTATGFSTFDESTDKVTLTDATEQQIDNIEADTNEMQGDLTDAGRLDALIDAIKAKTDNLKDTWNDPTSAATATAVMAKVVDGSIDVTQCLTILLAVFGGDVAKSDNTYTFKDQAGATKVTAVVSDSAVDRTIA